MDGSRGPTVPPAAAGAEPAAAAPGSARTEAGVSRDVRTAPSDNGASVTIDEAVFVGERRDELPAHVDDEGHVHAAIDPEHGVAVLNRQKAYLR